jgi:hypothetical protein
MPIRALAAGGRVTPHLGPRPPAWPPPDPGAARDACAPRAPPGLPRVLRGGLSRRRGLVGAGRRRGVWAGRCRPRAGPEPVGTRRRRCCPDGRAGGGGGRGGRERVARHRRLAERAQLVGRRSLSRLRFARAACVRAAARLRYAPPRTRSECGCASTDGVEWWCPRGRAEEAHRGRGRASRFSTHRCDSRRASASSHNIHRGSARSHIARRGDPGGAVSRAGTTGNCAGGRGALGIWV